MSVTSKAVASSLLPAPIELIIGIAGSVVFIAMLLYRLHHGRKAVRLGAAAGSGCASAVSGVKGGEER